MLEPGNLLIWLLNGSELTTQNTGCVVIASIQQPASVLAPHYSSGIRISRSA